MKPKRACRYVACAKARGLDTSLRSTTAISGHRTACSAIAIPSGEPSLIDVETLPHRIEGDAEERTVRDVHGKSERTPTEADRQHVRVVAAEHTLVERLL